MFTAQLCCQRCPRCFVKHSLLYCLLPTVRPVVLSSFPGSEFSVGKTDVESVGRRCQEAGVGWGGPPAWLQGISAVMENRVAGCPVSQF